MKTILFAMAVVTALTGCKKPVEQTVTSTGSSNVVQTATMKSQPEDPRILCDNKPFTDGELQRAALDVIYPRLSHVDGVEAQIKTAYAKLHKMEEFTATIQNSKIRDAYSDWLNYYRHEYDESARVARERLAGGQAETDKEQEERRRQAEAARTHELAKCLPKPKSENQQ